MGSGEGGLRIQCFARIGGPPSKTGDLVAEIYQTLWEYKHTRIHSALKMPLSVFAEQIAAKQKTANYCLKKPILYTETGLGKATERFLDVCSVIRTLSQVSQLLQNCQVSNPQVSLDPDKPAALRKRRSGRNSDADKGSRNSGHWPTFRS